MNKNIQTNFTLLSDIVPDAIQEIRYFSDYNFIGDKIDGYEEPIAITTKDAAIKLKEANDEFKTLGYKIKIYDAYRPKRAVDHFVKWVNDPADIRMKKIFYPNIDKKDLFELGYIAHKSGHTRGSTFDLTLVYEDTEKELDMGGPFDYFGKLSHPDFKNLNNEQLNNRKVLQKIMIKHGFNSFPLEWWHFTLVDEPYPDTYFDFPVKTDFYD